MTIEARVEAPSIRRIKVEANTKSLDDQYRAGF
jgi:hypothetical protein